MTGSKFGPCFDIRFVYYLVRHDDSCSVLPTSSGSVPVRLPASVESALGCVKGKEMQQMIERVNNENNMELLNANSRKSGNAARGPFKDAGDIAIGTNVLCDVRGWH